MHIRRATQDNRGLKTPKTDKSHEVDLLPPAVEALSAQKRLTYFFEAKVHPVELPDKTTRIDKIRFVFSPKATDRQNIKSEHDYFGKTAPNKMWKRTCERAGIKYRNIYQFRHTYASWMLSYGGVNIAYLAEQMGHSNFLMIAKVYAKWMRSENLRENEKAWEGIEARKRVFCSQ